MTTNGNGNGNGHGGPAMEATWNRWADSMINESAAYMRRASRLPFLWQQSQRVKKGVTPSEVVYEEDRMKVLHYLSPEKPKYKTPLLFVFALVNRPYILDLKPGKSVVEHFVKRGFDTYLIDWGVPTDAERHLRMDDYVNGYMANVISHVGQRTKSKELSVLGYCMGGTMSAMYTALHQEMVKNLILMAAGIDFSKRDGLLQLWTDASVFDVDAFVDAFGNAPASFLQSMFLMLKPVQNLIEKPLNFIERMEDEAFVDDYLTMEGWLNDNIPVPGEVFREFVKNLYQRNRLVKGEMQVGQKLVNLKDITCPILNLMAEKDDLVPCSQSAVFNDLVSSTDRQSINFKAGHIGLAVSSRAQQEVWPKVCDWLATRSDPAVGEIAKRGRKAR